MVLEWTDMSIEQESHQMIARLSTRVFLGPELCQNQEWLKIITNYADEVWAAITSLNYFPAVLQPLANKLLPSCRKYRQTSARGRELINSLAEQRREQYRDLEAKGQPLPKAGGNIVWMDDLAKGIPYDLAGAQFFM